MSREKTAGKKTHDTRQEGGREGPLKGKEGSADINERGISHPATALEDLLR